MYSNLMQTGMSRPIDNLGRIVIPMEIRRGLGWKTDDRLDVAVGTYNGEAAVVLCKRHVGCIICGATHDLQGIPGTKKLICKSCMKTITE